MATPPNQAHLYFCVAPPRSGLTALTACLRCMGVEPLNGEVDGHSINTTLLQELGISPNQPKTLPENWLETPAAATAREQIDDLLNQLVTSGKIAYLADPLLCRTLPLWQQALKKLAATEKVIKVSYLALLRHPWEGMQSIMAEHHLRKENAQKLWLVYLQDMLNAMKGCTGTLITFDQLLTDPATALNNDFPTAKAINALLKEVQPTKRSWQADTKSTKEIKDTLLVADIYHQMIGSAPSLESQWQRATETEHQNRFASLSSLITLPKTSPKTKNIARQRFHRTLRSVSMREDQEQGSKISWKQVTELAQQAKDKTLISQLDLSREKSWEELKAVSRVIRYTKEQSMYEDLLAGYDQDLKLLPANPSAHFIGTGVGTGSLDSYRVLESSGEKLLEKVFTNDSQDFEKHQWFVKNVKPLLDPDIVRTPAIREIRVGQKLTAVYYEYMPFTPLPISEVPSRAIEITNYLSTIDVKGLENITDEILEYKNDAIYKEGLAKSRDFIRLSVDESEFIKFDLIDREIDSLPKVFSHGDLFSKNLGHENIVIDWDRCGIYPPGYDISLALGRSYFVYDLKRLEEYLKRSCLVNNFNRKKFLAHLYYCFLSYSRKVVLNTSNDFLIQLSGRLIRLL